MSYFQWRRENFEILDEIIKMDHSAARAVAARPADIHAKNVQRNAFDQRAKYLHALSKKLRKRTSFFG